MNFKPPETGPTADVPVRRDRGNLRYRPDVDGLRAIAVLGVLFFHVGFGSFSGGWVGVDVFFVISGFLITRLISDEIDSGSFSFANFYTRRARRLFASFIFTVAATFIAASLIFDRVYLQHFAGEVVYALVAASNFFYWLDGGYFGVAERYKPLLHTWSLGIEEQFYLLWPLTLVLTLRYLRRYLSPLLVLAALGSLLLAEYFFQVGAERAVFLLLPSRIFEFAIGAMLVWLVRPPGAGLLLFDGALLAGLALIFLAMFAFTTSTPFPGINALVPCLGAALVIFGGTSTHLRWLLGNPLMVGIGKISYSLYLIHWPLIVFYSYHRLAPLNHFEQSMICIAAILAAVLMYTFIEQPFRDPRRVRFASRTAVGLTCTAGVLVLMVPASIVWAKGSLFWRGSVAAVSAEQLQHLQELSRQAELNALLEDRPFAPDSGRTRLMFIGDSHSGDIAAALFLALGTDRYDFARAKFAPACFSAVDRRPWILRLTRRKSPCQSQIEAVAGNRSLAKADYLFIAGHWSEETLKGFDEGLASLRAHTRARIILVGQNAIFPTFDDSLRFLNSAQLQRLNDLVYQQQSLADVQVNEQLRNLAAADGLGFIDRQSLVCPPSTALCQVRSRDGRFLYSDSNHWSYAGRSLFGRLMVERFGYLFPSDNARAGK